MKPVMIRAATLPALFALGACATTSQTSHTGGATAQPQAITLSVGPCFGFCPVYELTVDAAGGVVFQGSRHTAILGERRRRVSPATYATLAADLARFKPTADTSSPVECTAAVSDTSAYTVTWSEGGDRKVVAVSQSGCPGGPAHDMNRVLRDMPDRLGVADWAKQTTRPGEGRG
ncbi:MAG TPA: DUF6438 domain-containing protein [Vicinamibacterales bacterium]